MCQKMFGVSAVEWLNYQQCSKLIEALKSMLKRQKEKEEQDEGLQANSEDVYKRQVYMWHPSIRNTSGKDEVAELYKSFGMTIFHDMLPRAKKAHELDELLRNAQREVQRIQEEIEELSCPTLRVEE